MRTRAPLPSSILLAALLALVARPAHAEAPAPAPPARPAPAEDDTRTFRFTAGVSLTSLGLLTGILGGVLAVRAAVDKGQVGAHCNAAARCDLVGYTLGSEAQDFARVSTVVSIAAAIGTGAGIGLLVSALQRKPRAAAWITPTAGGLVISGGARW